MPGQPPLLWEGWWDGESGADSFLAFMLQRAGLRDNLLGKAAQEACLSLYSSPVPKIAICIPVMLQEGTLLIATWEHLILLPWPYFSLPSIIFASSSLTALIPSEFLIRLTQVYIDLSSTFFISTHPSSPVWANVASLASPDYHKPLKAKTCWLSLPQPSATSGNSQLSHSCYVAMSDREL